MIRVEGRDTTAAIKRTRHHTPGIVELILEAAVALLLNCPLARDDKEHVLKQRRSGAMSYGLYLSDGRQYHFRPGEGGHDATSIRVYDRYKYGDSPPLAVLSKKKDIWAFFESLTVENSAAVA